VNQCYIIVAGTLGGAYLFLQRKQKEEALKKLEELAREKAKEKAKGEEFLRR